MSISTWGSKSKNRKDNITYTIVIGRQLDEKIREKQSEMDYPPDRGELIRSLLNEWVKKKG